MKASSILCTAMTLIALCAGLTPSAANANPEVAIASGPLFSGRANVHPNLLLSLSVEYPTVGVAYRGNGGTYDRTRDYIGYFNPAKCYTYTGDPRKPNEDISPDLAKDDYFRISKNADALHECGGGSFSGNFMNWVSSSAIDMLRYALTGGDRIVDTPEATVLRRAVLRDASDANFYAHSTYFPRRVVVAGDNVSAPNQVTPFDTGTLYVVSCRNRILFSDQTSGVQGDEDGASASDYCTYAWNGQGKTPKQARDKRLGEYLVRVRVCDGVEGPKRKSLCQKYGDHYKPVGEIQRKSGSLRLGAMAYLLDDAATRYGGVLRAPMKYVGSKKLEAPDFLAIDNDRREWDPATGVFYRNPDDPSDRDSSTVNSGVINYVNKFGRSGAYKTYDPVGELYYEGLRYLQGKTPTPDATSGMSNAMKDGFPVLEKWADPMIASCQSNYLLTIADVNTHWDRYIPGNNRTTFGNGSDAHDSTRAADGADEKTPALDVKTWTQKVGDMESDASGDDGSPSPNPDLAGLQDKDTGASGHGTYYLAGLAYWAHVNNIRLDNPARVTTLAIDVDEGGNGQIDDNPRGIPPRNSQLYLAAKYGGFNDLNGDSNPFITLADDNKTTIKGSSKEWDGNGDGVPDNYFLAGQPKEMIQAIRDAFSRMAEASGTIAGVSVSTTMLASGDAYVYQPGFDSAAWSGSLRKLALVKNEDTIELASTADWDAGKKLTDVEEMPTSPARKDRHIFTGQLGEDGAWSTVDFKWNALSEQQQALLDKAPAEDEPDGQGEKRLDFLRGDRSLEQSHVNGVFRTRNSVLGDIINSNPVYVGAPAANVQGDGYQKFYDDHKKRKPAVYVGANDGMLHAFDADDGKELFAYVPNALLPYLNCLTQPGYTHRPYVDGALTAAEAKSGGSWKTILASGMGGGAQGVFALDVTDPAKFASGTGALFEFTDADDPDMGNLMGAPAIAKFRTKLDDGVPEYRYFLVVPSGLNNYRDDGEGRFNNDGAGALFLLSLDKKASDDWQLGVNYFKFRTASTSAALANGLSTPALAVGADGAVRFAYAGDLQGQLWRFDFTGAAPWPNALPGATPLFTAQYKNSAQPITLRPSVVFAPGGGYLVLFGTGKFMESGDAAAGNFAMQSFYGIADTTDSEYTVTGRAELMARMLEKSGDGVKIGGDAFSYGAGANGRKGWYLDFAGADKTGERAVTDPLTMSGLVFFNSLIPGGDPCKPGGGRSYVLNALTGLPANGELTGFLSQVGMLGSPVVLQTDTEVGARNAIGRRLVSKHYTVFSFGTGGAKGMAAPAENGSGVTEVPAGRFSWREIVNWQELRDALAGK